MKFEVDMWEVPEWTERVAYAMFRRHWMDTQVQFNKPGVEDPEKYVFEMWGMKDIRKPWYGLAGEALRCLKGYERSAMVQRKGDGGIEVGS